MKRVNSDIIYNYVKCTNVTFVQYNNQLNANAMGDVPRHRSRVQGGWAVNKNVRSDRDKPKIPQAPRWLGKNIDIHPTNTRSSHTKGASCSSSSGSRTMGGGDTFIYEAPTEVTMTL